MTAQQLFFAVKLYWHAYFNHLHSCTCNTHSCYYAIIPNKIFQSGLWTFGLWSRLQSVQNAAARLVSWARRYNRITPVLQEPHWLPVRRRMDFKMATLVYLSLSGMPTPYLAADCQLVSDEGRCQLRSANSRTCIVRRTCSSYGDRCFAAAGPRLWNSLPAHLRQTDVNFEQFKWQLKTFLFGRWQHGTLWLLLNCAY